MSQVWNRHSSLELETSASPFLLLLLLLLLLSSSSIRTSVCFLSLQTEQKHREENRRAEKNHRHLSAMRSFSSRLSLPSMKILTLQRPLLPFNSCHLPRHHHFSFRSTSFSSTSSSSVYSPNTSTTDHEYRVQIQIPYSTHLLPNGPPPSTSLTHKEELLQMYTDMVTIRNMEISADQVQNHYLLTDSMFGFLPCRHFCASMVPFNDAHTKITNEIHLNMLIPMRKSEIYAGSFPALPILLMSDILFTCVLFYLTRTIS